MTKQKWMMIIRLIRPFLHISIISLIYRWAYDIRLHTDGLRFIDFSTPRIVTQEIIIYAIISIIIFIWIGIIKKRYDLVWIWLESIKKFFSVWWQWTISITCLAYFWQDFIFKNWISRLIIIWVAIGSLIIIPIFEIIRQWLYTNRIQQFSHSVLILYRENEQSENIINQINLPSYYKISKKSFSDQFSYHISEDIILLVGGYSQDELQKIVDTLRLQSKQLYHIGDNHFLEDIVYTPSKIGWLRSLRYKATELEWRSAVIKRICDIIGWIIILILASPIMIIAALAIFIETGGPIFYIQERIWKNWERFRFIKFRSMYTHLSVGEDYWWKEAQKLYEDLVNSHSNIRKWELPKIKSDPRVTKVGRILRATSIDELPNLFSVIQWDMSLIWPRPHLPSEIANYKPRQKRVLSIKPGITWYAQIHGRDTLSFDEEATKELEYIQNRNIFLDGYILFATIGVLFWGRWK